LNFAIAFELDTSVRVFICLQLGGIRDSGAFRIKENLKLQFHHIQKI